MFYDYVDKLGKLLDNQLICVKGKNCILKT